MQGGEGQGLGTIIIEDRVGKAVQGNGKVSQGGKAVRQLKKTTQIAIVFAEVVVVDQGMQQFRNRLLSALRPQHVVQGR